MTRILRVTETGEKLKQMPKMILFDYGQTLVNEQRFDGVKGTAAVMKFATKNKYHKTPEEIQEYADRLNREIGRFDPERRHLFQYEIPNHMFTKFLYESQGIEIALPPDELDTVFWDAAASGKPTEGIEEFLSYLKGKRIRTAVLSNISYSGKAVERRIRECMPNHEFEFILATSEYLYRKPNPHIFELALERAALSPGEVWYVGDQYKCDIEGAKGSGLFPVWYVGATDMKRNEAKDDVLTIESWKQFMEYLETQQ